MRPARDSAAAQPRQPNPARRSRTQKIREQIEPFLRPDRGSTVEAAVGIEVQRSDMARQANDPNNMIDIQSLVGAAYWHLGDLDHCEQTVRRFLAACEAAPRVCESGRARDIARSSPGSSSRAGSVVGRMRRDGAGNSDRAEK
jgi:hypothetical protein